MSNIEPTSGRISEIQLKSRDGVASLLRVLAGRRCYHEQRGHFLPTSGGKAMSAPKLLLRQLFLILNLKTYLEIKRRCGSLTSDASRNEVHRSRTSPRGTKEETSSIIQGHPPNWQLVLHLHLYTCFYPVYSLMIKLIVSGNLYEPPCRARRPKNT